MDVRRREIGLLPATERNPAVHRTSVVINARPYYVDTKASLTETEREAEIGKAIEDIKRGGGP